VACIQILTAFGAVELNYTPIPHVEIGGQIGVRDTLKTVVAWVKSGRVKVRSAKWCSAFDGRRRPIQVWETCRLGLIIQEHPPFFGGEVLEVLSGILIT